MYYLLKDNITGTYPVKVFCKEGAEEEPLHSHEYLQLWYVCHGSCIHTIHQSRSLYTRGGVMIVPPGVEHSIEADPASRRICCEFSEAFIREGLLEEGCKDVLDLLYLEPFLLGEHLLDHVFRVSKNYELVVEQLLEEMMDDYRSDGKYSGIFLKANLLKLLAIIAQEYDRNATAGKAELLLRYRGGLEQALEYIETHLPQKIYLADVCKSAMISHSAFSELFKQTTGKTFTEYLVDRRVAAACDLLKNSDRTMLDIALSCGFQDAAYFSRVFKRQLGVSPSEYRRENGK